MSAPYAVSMKDRTDYYRGAFKDKSRKAGSRITVISVTDRYQSNAFHHRVTETQRRQNEKGKLQKITAASARTIAARQAAGMLQASHFFNLPFALLCVSVTLW